MARTPRCSLSPLTKKNTHQSICGGQHNQPRNTQQYLGLRDKVARTLFAAIANGDENKGDWVFVVVVVAVAMVAIAWEEMEVD